MINEHENSLQNRFTAYLMRALDNQITRYGEKKERLKEKEYINMDLIDRGETLEFEAQFHTYKYEQYYKNFNEKRGLQIIQETLNEHRLVKALGRLKDREKAILFARIFGELTFAEIGDMFNMKPKQAEMAYYYIIRKLRQRMGE